MTDTPISPVPSSDPLNLARFKPWLCHGGIQWPTCDVAELVAEVERLRAEVSVLEDKLEYAEYGDDL